MPPSTPLTMGFYYKRFKKLGVCGTALSWFKSYLEERSQRICMKETLSQPFDLKWRVPQCSCLGPLLCTIYTQDVFSKC